MNNIYIYLELKNVICYKKNSYLKIRKDNSFSFNKIFHSEKKIIETRYSIVRKKRLVRGHSHFTRRS